MHLDHNRSNVNRHVYVCHKKETTYNQRCRQCLRIYRLSYKSFSVSEELFLSNKFDSSLFVFDVNLTECFIDCLISQKNAD